jgi:transcriptional regulator with XRE-family HTH domain
METTTKEETERVIRMLRTALRLLGFTNREIERRLAYTPSYLTRLFSGQIELRFEHIVDIVRATGMTVDEFFRFSYPDRGQKLSEPAQRLDAMLEEMRPTPRPPGAPPTWGESEFERAVASAVEKVVARDQEEHQQLLDLLEKVELLEKGLRKLSRGLRRGKRKPRPSSARSRPPARPRAKRQAPA